MPLFFVSSLKRLRWSWHSAFSAFCQQPYSKLWLSLLVSGSVLRLWLLDAPPLWYDERLEAWVVSLPLVQMLQAVGADVHPPLHYLLTWALTHAGLGSDWWLRVPSAVLGVLAIWQTRALARAWDLGETAALAAGVLVTFSPFQLNYSQEARVYALLQAIYLWAMLAIVRARWTQLQVALVLLVYSHNYGWLYAGILAPLAGGRLYGWLEDAGGQVTPRRWLLGMINLYLPAVVCYLPWYGVLAAQMVEQQVGWWKSASTLGGVLYVYHHLLWHITLAGLWSELAALALAVLLLAGLVQLVRQPVRTGPVLVYLMLAPVGAALAVELVYRPILLHRALIGAAVPMYLILAHGLATMPQRRMAWIILAPVLAVAAVAFHGQRHSQNIGQQLGGPDLYTYIQQHAQPGDVIVHGNVGTLVDGWRRLPESLPQQLMEIQPGSLGVPSPTFWRLLGVQMVPPDACCQAGRVWVVWSAGPSIALAEDAAVASLTAGAEPIWSASTPLADAGLWLLSTPPLTEK